MCCIFIIKLSQALQFVKKIFIIFMVVLYIVKVAHGQRHINILMQKYHKLQYYIHM